MSYRENSGDDLYEDILSGDDYDQLEEWEEIDARNHTVFVPSEEDMEGEKEWIVAENYILADLLDER